MRLSAAAFLIFVVSCGSSGDSGSKVSPKDTSIANSAQEESAQLLLGASPLPDSTLEELMSEANPAVVSNVEAFSRSDSNGSDEEFETLLGSPMTQALPSATKAVTANKDEAELALKRLEVNTLNHQKSIEDLYEINSFKDKTIASLSALNDELLTEIKRLKANTSKTLVKQRFDRDSNDKDGEIMSSEIQNLKNSLLLKSTEIKDLRMRNDSLEKRISSLETSPMPSISLRSPASSDTSFDERKDSMSSGMQLPAQDPDCVLKFDAVVTSLNGKSKEAFYTEFFVVKEDLESVMFKGGVDLAAYPTIATYSELWARSRKNSFLFPGMQKRFRALLLDLVEGGKGMRVRTNIDGFATVTNLNSGKYYVVGTASLGKVGVTWSVPVTLSAGTNKLSLTLENAAWSL